MVTRVVVGGDTDHGKVGKVGVLIDHCSIGLNSHYFLFLRIQVLLYQGDIVIG